MQKIKKYLRKEVKNDNIPISVEEIAIMEDLVKFYFEEILTKDISKLDEERKSVKHLLDISFYKELGREIEKVNVKKALEEKEKTNNVIKLLLSDKVKTFEDLTNLSGLSLQEIKKTLQNKKLILEYDDETFIKIGEKISVLEDVGKTKEQVKRNDEKRMHKLRKYDEYLWIYLNSRYRADHFPSISDCFLKTLEKNIQKEEFREYYPENIIEMLRDKGEELKRFKDRKDTVVIRNAKTIAIVKPEIVLVTPFILSKLELVVNFFDNFGNIERMAKNSETIPSYNNILSSLMLPVLEEYLTEEAYLKLSKYLCIEKMYQSLNYAKRVRLVRDTFLKYSGNLYSVVKDKNEEELALRMLSDKLVKQEFGNELYNRTLNLLEEYKEKRCVIDELEKVKVKEKVLKQ